MGQVWGSKRFILLAATRLSSKLCSKFVLRFVPECISTRTDAVTGATKMANSVRVDRPSDLLTIMYLFYVQINRILDEGDKILQIAVATRYPFKCSYA